MWEKHPIAAHRDVYLTAPDHDGRKVLADVIFVLEERKYRAYVYVRESDRRLSNPVEFASRKEAQDYCESRLRQAGLIH